MTPDDWKNDWQSQWQAFSEDTPWEDSSIGVAFESSDYDEWNTHPSRRWYDTITNVTSAVHISKHLPEPVRKLVGQNLEEHISDYRSSTRKDRKAISLGATKILGLYKAGYRKRWYDQAGTHLTRAFNMMSVIPEHFLSEYATRILDVASYIEYQKNHGMLTYNPLEIDNAIENILLQGLPKDSAIKDTGKTDEAMPTTSPSSSAASSFVSFREENGSIRLVMTPHPDQPVSASHENDLRVPLQSPHQPDS